MYMGGTPMNPMARRPMRAGGRVDYGIGGALLKLGSNLAAGKGFGKGALKGVGKAAITPGSGIGAGTSLAGNLLQKSKNPALQGIGKSAGVASNFMPGGGGFGGAIGALAGGGGQGGGGGFLQNMASNIHQGGGLFSKAGEIASNLGQGGGQGLFNMIQQSHGGMINYSAGGPTPEQLAEASQILANMGKEEKIAKYGMMSDEAILQEIAKSLDGGEAAPTPNQPESKAGDRAYFEDPVEEEGRSLLSKPRTQHEIDMANAKRDRRHEEEIAEGGNRSLAQAAYDELSQIGMGLRGVSDALDDQRMKSPYGRGEFGGSPADPSTAAFPDLTGAFKGAYGREEDADRARMHSGAKGSLDARNPFSVAYDFARGSDVTSPGSAAFQPGRGMDYVREGIERRESPVRQFAGGRVKLRKRY